MKRTARVPGSTTALVVSVLAALYYIFFAGRLADGGFLNGLGGHWVNSVEPLVTVALLTMAGFVATASATRNLLTSSRSFYQLMLLSLLLLVVYGKDFRLDGASALLLTTAGYYCLCNSFSRTVNFRQIFKGSFLLGCAPLVFPPAIFTLPALLLALAIFRRNAREAVVALFAYILPFLMVSYILWAFGNEFLSVYGSLRSELDLGFGHLPRFWQWEIESIIRFCSLAIFGVIAVLALLTFFIDRGKMRTRAYTITSFYLLTFIISTAILLFGANFSGNLITTAIPAAMLADGFFERHSSRWSNILNFLLITIAVLYALTPFMPQIP